MRSFIRKCMYLFTCLWYPSNYQDYCVLVAAHGVISQLHMLRISKCVNWLLRIPMLSISCHEAMTLVIKPCALIPDSVHMCCTLVRETCSQRRGLQLRSCQIGIEITDYTGDKISVGVARPSHVFGQSVPCDG